ncbi:hypothetical protein B0675_06440 [Streptomyces sp. M41(2017)]|nr:hypothetical protein B0675_06440 [Streptomyces sp. M41(2017)]
MDNSLTRTGDSCLSAIRAGRLRRAPTAPLIGVTDEEAHRPATARESPSVTHRPGVPGHGAPAP